MFTAVTLNSYFLNQENQLEMLRYEFIFSSVKTIESDFFVKHQKYLIYVPISPMYYLLNKTAVHHSCLEVNCPA